MVNIKILTARQSKGSNTASEDTRKILLIFYVNADPMADCEGTDKIFKSSSHPVK